MRESESEQKRSGLSQHQPFEVACTKIIYNFSTCKLIEPYVALRAMVVVLFFLVFSDMVNVAFHQANASKKRRQNERVRRNAFMVQIKLFHPYKMCISEWPFFACGVNVFHTLDEIAFCCCCCCRFIEMKSRIQKEVIAYRLNSPSWLFSIDDLYIVCIFSCPIFSNFRAHIIHLQQQIIFRRSEKKISRNQNKPKNYWTKYVNFPSISPTYRNRIGNSFSHAR